MKTVGFLLMTLFFLLASVPWLRIYFRTGLKGALLNGVGAIVGAIGVPGFLYCLDSPPVALPLLPFLFLALMIVALLFVIIAMPVMYIKESGSWKEIRDKTPYWKRVIGSVPIVKYEKPPFPSANRRTHLVLGVTMMVASILAFIFFKRTMYFSVASIAWFIMGLLYVILSFVYLTRKRHHR